MFSRHRPTQALFVWLAFVAIGLSAFAPMVSQLLIVPAIGQQTIGLDAMADMGPYCHGHAPTASTPAVSDRDANHGGMPMEACGYCSFMAHHPVVATVPVILMRPPALLAAAAQDTLPLRALFAPWLFDAAPRGPPIGT